MSLTTVDFPVKEAIVSLVSRGVPLLQAARQVGGIGKRELNELMTADPQFREALDEAHEIMVSRVDHTVYLEALDGNSKFAELFYRQHRPEIMQSGAQAQRQANAPQIHIAQMVVAVTRELLTGDHGMDLIQAMHHPEIVEAVVVEDDDDE